MRVRLLSVLQGVGLAFAAAVVGALVLGLVAAWAPVWDPSDGLLKAINVAAVAAGGGVVRGPQGAAAGLAARRRRGTAVCRAGHVHDGAAGEPGPPGHRRVAQGRGPRVRRRGRGRHGRRGPLTPAGALPPPGVREASARLDWKCAKAPGLLGSRGAFETDLAVRAVAKRLVLRVAAAAQRKGLARFEHVAFRVLDDDGARHPQRHFSTYGNPVLGPDVQ